jgi:flagellin
VSLRVQNNIQAFNAHRQLTFTASQAAKSMERLSSGFRINRAGDDAAGLGISERMRGQISGLGQAQRNAQNGVSMIQTAEGNLGEVHNMLQRVRELAVQYKNGGNSVADQTAIQSEVNQLAAEIERIGVTSKFNGISLMNAAGTISFQVGTDDGQVIAMTTASLGATVGTTYDDLTATGTTDISEIDAAINGVSALRAQLGAVQNRLEHTMQAQGAYRENLVAAESRIRDVDMAEESVRFAKFQILQQAGTAMLAQANQSTQNVLSLLR